MSKNIYLRTIFDSFDISGASGLFKMAAIGALQHSISQLVQCLLNILISFPCGVMSIGTSYLSNFQPRCPLLVTNIKPIDELTQHLVKMINIRNYFLKQYFSKLKKRNDFKNTCKNRSYLLNLIQFKANIESKPLLQLCSFIVGDLCQVKASQ